MARAAFEIYFCQLDFFCDLLKLKRASGRYSNILKLIWNYHLQIAQGCLQRVSADICKLHRLCHILKPTCANCLGLETLGRKHVSVWKCTQHFGARVLMFLSSCCLPSCLPSRPLFSLPLVRIMYCCLSVLSSTVIPFSFDKFARRSPCQCSMRQVCQLLSWGRQPIALVAA